MKPSEIIIGITDFFAVLLPGALLAFFLNGYAHQHLFGEQKIFPEPQTAAQQWVAFLLAAYILGSLVQIPASWPARWLYRKFRYRLYEKNHGLAYRAATKIREQHLASVGWMGPLGNSNHLYEEAGQNFQDNNDTSMMNTFRWAQHYLQVKHPGTLWEAKKTEAGSKLFRNLAVVFFIMGIILPADKQIIPTLTCLFLGTVCLYRYGSLRYNATGKIYELVITATRPMRVATEQPVTNTEVKPLNLAKQSASGFSVNLYNARIDTLTHNGNKTARLEEITQNGMLQQTFSTDPEKIFCLEGRALLETTDANGKELQAVLSKDALFTALDHTTIKIENPYKDPLLLVFIK